MQGDPNISQTMATNEKNCSMNNVTQYESITGVMLAIPEWQAILTAITLALIILLTVVGNILVVLSVFTYKPLRIVQNFFIVSLAVADLTVAVLVLPFSVAYIILGEWKFGIHVCKMWLTCDILCCTASILNLCAIALDRYWAITDPINYAQQRTLNRVMGMIIGVWVVSALISSPPLLGWNDWPGEEEFNKNSVCQLTSQQGYVVYSSLGSFFIPLFIMTIVYIEIFVATRRRLRERAKASRLNMQVRHNDVPNQQAVVVSKDQIHPSPDQDSVSSETNHNEHPQVEEVPSGKNKEKKRKNKKKLKSKAAEEKIKYLAPMLVMDDSITENNDSASGSNHHASPNHVDDNHTTNTTNTESPRSRNQDAEAPVVAPVVVPPAAKKPVVVYQFIEEKQRISLSKERRAARTLGIIMGVFVVCWLPFFLLYVIEPFCATCCPSSVLVHFITWQGYINSALNPIIYTIFNMDFRRAFKKLLRMKP